MVTDETSAKTTRIIVSEIPYPEFCPFRSTLVEQSSQKDIAYLCKHEKNYSDEDRSKVVICQPYYGISHLSEQGKFPDHCPLEKLERDGK